MVFPYISTQTETVYDSYVMGTKLKEVKLFLTPGVVSFHLRIVIDWIGTAQSYNRFRTIALNLIDFKGFS